jgi:hypothetical protein
MNEKLIPPGTCCYVNDKNGQLNCPYLIKKNIKGIGVPWCKYLNKGGIDNNWTQEERNTLVNYYGSAKNMFEELPLEGIGIATKDCTINKKAKEEDFEEWCKNIKNFYREQKLKRMLGNCEKVI